MNDADRQEVPDVLACEFDKRPRGAPTFFDVAPAVLAVRRGEGGLEVEFAPAAAAAVAGFVAAERLCCPEIRWELGQGGVHLRVAATPGQLDQLAELFSHPPA